MKVLNLGSLNIDKTYIVEHFAEEGETIQSATYDEFCGGKGLNQSIALAKAGADVFHAGCVGEDGTILLETLQKAGVKTELICKSREPSGHAIIQVNRDGQNNHSAQISPYSRMPYHRRSRRNGFCIYSSDTETETECQ